MIRIPTACTFRCTRARGPCNNDIDRARYLADVDAAIAFIQGNEERGRSSRSWRQINTLATEEKFEEAELVRRQLEKVQKARKEVKDKFPSIWGFDYLVLLPSDSTSRTKVAFVRAGSVDGV